MSAQGRQITVNDIQLNVIIEGSGPDVILLHGFPDSAYVWRKQIPALVQGGFRVIAPDLRGCGDSEAPVGKRHYTINAIIGDILELMSSLNIPKASVVAHDWGANIGWFLASRYPQLVESYVALSVGHTLAYRKAGPAQMLRAWYAALFLLPGISEAIIKASNWRFLRKITNDHTEIDHWIETLSRPGRLTAGINWYRANAVTMLTADVPRVTVPCLGIWSNGDSFLTEQQMLNSARYCDGPWQYQRIVDAGHWIPLDAPEALNRILLSYLRRSHS